MAGNVLLELKLLLATPEPPEVGPGPRAGVQAEETLGRGIDQALAHGRLPAENQQLLRALVLLWHDHLEAAHAIAQGIDDADGALVHAILHRREPDYGNAKYWFRRVGQHPSYPELARRVKLLPADTAGQAMVAKLMPGQQWDPFVFVDLCQEAAERSGPAAALRWLREAQRVEFEVLLERFAAGGGQR